MYIVLWWADYKQRFYKPSLGSNSLMTTTTNTLLQTHTIIRFINFSNLLPSFSLFWGIWYQMVFVIFNSLMLFFSFLFLFCLFIWIIQSIFHTVFSIIRIIEVRNRKQNEQKDLSGEAAHWRHSGLVYC